MNDDMLRDFMARVAAAGDRASLQEVGEALGIDRGQADEISMQLMGEGFLEIVSLSGAVRLTDAGKSAIGAGGDSGEDDLAALVAEMAACGDFGLPPGTANDLSCDLRALQAQMERSRSLGGVIDALVSEVEAALAASDDPQARALVMRLRAARG
jgi:hypothetical protein